LSYLNGHYPNISELNNRTKGGKIYTCGYTVIEYILSKYGQDNLIYLIKNYGNLKSTFNVTDDQFCKDWYNYVTRKIFEIKKLPLTKVFMQAVLDVVKFNSSHSIELYIQRDN